MPTAEYSIELSWPWGQRVETPLVIEWAEHPADEADRNINPRLMPSVEITDVSSPLGDVVSRSLSIREIAANGGPEMIKQAISFLACRLYDIDPNDDQVVSMIENRGRD